ncbi:FAD-binding oxidoreductase [Bosea sp. LjRoot9]|uniref:FAD-binding oxidoreductase n=1 Tax=Bosea sp. LjRoot9 TaxID=3342341 RepID=UPI003ECE1792
MLNHPSLLDSLIRLLGPQGVLHEAADMAGFTEDWRGRVKGPALCVVLPSNTSQVSQIVRLCAAHGTPLLPQGGNTSLMAGAVPHSGDKPPVIVSLRRMRSIRALDTQNNTIAVDAGCILAEIHRAAADAGRLYPVSLGAEGSCMIGGNIATNAGGTSVLRYGNTRDNVLGIEVVLADGAVWNGMYGLRKNNTGYDLKHLFIGSEGTLGIITGAVLKLHALPTQRALAWLTVISPQQALDILTMVRERDETRLTAFELLNETQVRLVADNVPGQRCPAPRLDAWHVMIELSDASSEQGELDRALESVLERAYNDGLCTDAVVATTEAQRAAFWQFRHSTSESNKKGGIGLNTDAAVPVSAVPRFIEEATAAMHTVVPDLPTAVTVHMGDGNVHYIPYFTFEAWNALADRDVVAGRLRRVVNEVAADCAGTFSAEHGIGRTFLPEMEHFKQPLELAMMRAIKHVLDPNNLLNPGPLLPPGPIYGQRTSSALDV